MKKCLFLLLVLSACKGTNRRGEEDLEWKPAASPRPDYECWYAERGFENYYEANVVCLPKGTSK